MTKAIWIIKLENCKKIFDQLRKLITRKNVELNNIFNSVNFHDLNFTINKIEL